MSPVCASIEGGDALLRRLADEMARLQGELLMERKVTSLPAVLMNDGCTVE